MADFILGLNAKMYHGSAALTTLVSADDVTWTEIPNVAEVNLDLTSEESDMTTRASDGWTEMAQTLRSASVSFVLKFKDSDTYYEALRDAWLNNTEITLLFMDKNAATTGAQGLAANFMVNGMPRGEPLNDVIKYTFTVKPSSHVEWYEKAAS